MVLSIVSVIILTSIVVYSADAAGIPKKAISTVARFLESDLPTTTVFTDQAATLTGNPITINNLALGGNLNVGSNALTNSNHQVTIPLNTGTVLLNNGSGSSLTGVVTSITGTANNLTTSSSTGAVTLNLGSNVVTTGGSAQTFTKSVFFDGLGLAYVKKTAAYTATNNDDVILVDASGANPTIITLPDAATDKGKMFIVKKNDTSGNTVMIKGNGAQKIDGISNQNLTNNEGTITVQSDGSNWYRLDRLSDDIGSYRISGATNNRWFGTAMTQDASSTIIDVSSTLRAYPFVVPKTITIDQIMTEVSTAGTTTTNTCRIGIYRDNGNQYPASLVTNSDTGTFTQAAAVKGPTSFSSPITLNSGLYWFAYACQTSTTMPTFRGVAVSAIPNVLGYVSTMGANGAGTGWTVSFTYGALPTTYPASGTVLANNVAPMILVRITG